MAWLKGLMAAGINGLATAITVMVVGPMDFNLAAGLNKLLAAMGVSALLGMALYLKQSPLPGVGGQSGLGKLGKLGIVLLVCSLFMAGGPVGCANQTATGQMVQQTNNVGKIAQAAYFDAQGVYKATAETFLDYRGFISRDEREQAKKALNDMKAILDGWNALSGLAQIDAINFHSGQFRDLRRQVLFLLADYIDKGGA